MLGFIRYKMRRLLRRWPRAYARAKRSFGHWTYRFRIPHDPDYRLFGFLRGPDDLIVDVGANTGQSARSIRIYNRTSKIYSFEPNRSLEPELIATAALIGRKFCYRMVGLGSQPGQVRLFVPVRQGLAFTPWATTEREQLERIRHQIRDDIGGDFTIEEHPIDVCRFDDFELLPAAIKIDVEGLELDVLEGMQQTLAACEPILMLEESGTSDQVAAHLQQAGFGVYSFDSQRGLIEVYRQIVVTSPNFFAITPKKLELLQTSGVRLGPHAKAQLEEALASLAAV